MFDVTSQWTEERVAVAAPEPAPEPAPRTAGAGARARGPARHAPRRAPQRPRAAQAAAPPRAGARRRPAARAGAGASSRCSRSSPIVLAAWFLWSLYQPGKGEGSGRVVVQVPRGATVGQIGDLLADRGVIDSAFFFRLRAKLSGSADDLKSGTFTLREDMSYGAALDALSRTPARRRR